MKAAYSVPHCRLSSEDLLRLPGHCVSTPQQFRGFHAFFPPAMPMGKCQCQKHGSTLKRTNLFCLTHHHCRLRQRHRWVQNQNDEPIQFRQNRTSCNALELLSFFNSFAFVCFFFLLLFFAPATRFLPVTSATSSTTLSASFRCLLASLAARAARLSASFVSDAFLAARSEGVLRTDVIRPGGVPRTPCAPRRF